LVKRALELQKACSEQDAQFLKEWDEMKVLAKKYQEEVLDAGTEAWLVPCLTLFTKLEAGYLRGHSLQLTRD
jgi:hypothetical protein